MTGARAVPVPLPVDARRGGANWRPWAPGARRWLVLSVLVQLGLAFAFGHSHDARVFMATGYLVGHGLNPYAVADLSTVFGRAAFDLHSTVGYPPPWPLVLGLLSAVYAAIPSLVLYNAVIKLPVIAANVALALLTACVLTRRGIGEARTRRAYYGLLFNPALLFFGAAWGQIDALAAVLALAATLLLARGAPGRSGVALAAAVCVKPTALPLVLPALAALLRRPLTPLARYVVAFAAAAVVLVAAPFLLPGWSLAPILGHWNAHFEMSGALSLMTVARLVRDPLNLPQAWWPLGLLWLPALALAALSLRHAERDLDALLKQSLGLTLVVFLTRTWLSEPNAVLLIPFAVILAAEGLLDARLATALWALPLAFAVVNAAPLQVLFVNFPAAMERSLAAYAQFHPLTLTVRAALVVAWQAVGWWVVVRCLHPVRKAQCT